MSEPAAVIEQESKVREGVLTPLMQQYIDIKSAHPGSLLFFRLGDFYELFFDDAKLASKELDLVLTRRGNIEGANVPMCGVPFHAAESYIERLIKAGFKIAICEQLEDPATAKKRGAKSIVRRDVVRIITPGTVTEENMLESRKASFLCSITSKGKEIGLSWVDISTGDFFTSKASKETLISELSRINPKEILLSEKVLQDEFIRSSVSDWKQRLTTQVESFFEFPKAERKIKTFYKVVSIDAFGKMSQEEITSCGALLEYLDLTQKGVMPRLTTPKKYRQDAFMQMDSFTRRNLEIFYSLAGDFKSSLISVIDKTITSAGARLLYSFISSPLLDVEKIKHRQDAVAFLIENERLKSKIANELMNMPDMERALSRLSLSRGGPRDILAVRQALIKVMNILQALEEAGDRIPKEFSDITKRVKINDQLVLRLNEALNDDVPMLAREGNFIKPGFNVKLDQSRAYLKDGEDLKAALREKYKKQTGIASLKVSENNIIGFYVEVTSNNLDKVPDSFIHRQTMAGAVRYTTPELREIEHKIINAKEHLLSLELELFAELVKDILAEAENISIAAKSMALVDVYFSFAQSAIQYKYCRPLVNESLNFNIKNGRHPVVEVSNSGDFKPNDLSLSDEDIIWLLTGPNMAGKSTFLRQNALIAIMAQAGSYVPADSAEIGIINKLFSRVGAADDLARGRSTFMVEMIETAAILNQADENSFVILDEIGRGTATFDGLSIAFAVLENIHQVNKCRTIFATHYHELTKLTNNFNHLSCHTMKIREWNDEIIFLHEVVEGTADKSYGIYVAKLAGLPKKVTDRAEEILINLDKSEVSKKIIQLPQSLPLFSEENEKNKKFSAFSSYLESVDLDSISPKEALEILYKLKIMSKK